MRQYYETKEKYPGTILFFRVGDFYETFSDDAVLVSKELGITLTKRNNGGDQTPLAGFPFHALDTYLPKLVRRGHKVAICEQTQDPEEAKAQKKLVEREVTEVVTPGTAFSDKLLDHNRNNYICSIHIQGSSLGVAFSDISTGEFALSQMEAEDLHDILDTIQPSEVLASKKWVREWEQRYKHFNFSIIEDWVFEGDFGYTALLDHFKTHSLKGFGVDELHVAHAAAGALLHYVRENQKSSLPHLRRLYAYENAEFIQLDLATKRNLELVSSIQSDSREGTLIHILDETCTAMGARLLRSWLMRPLKKLLPIKERLNAVEAWHTRHDYRIQLREVLEEVGDLERLISRISVGRSGPRDLVQLKRSLSRIPLLKALIADSEEVLIKKQNANLSLLDDVILEIDRALIDEAPAGIRDGGFIRDGYNKQLDEFRDIARNGKEYLAKIQKKLIEDSGINSLKLGYNKVFGYYIEVTNSHKDKIPDYFIRKQTLSNAERYITPDLKEIEEKILSAEEKMVKLEMELFKQVTDFVSAYTEKVQDNAKAIAILDVIQSFAEVSFRYNYVKPHVDESDVLHIEKGRHPVVERSMPLGEPFIPNDVQLNNSSEQIMIITGPNMAGKSIILRQTGLIVLMAQIGCFVPAAKVNIGLVDKIFTRVGASDNLAAGESTFLVEMNEAANILNNATPRSLILLDEVGRGTSTFDGLSIAWSIAEYLHNQPAIAAKTLFATHYHELNELESLYERVVNYNVKVEEHEGKVIFLRKLIRGGTDHSFGIQVASMAGLPSVVIERAREILRNLESHSLDITNSNGTLDRGAKANTKEAVKKVEKQAPIPQLSLFQSTIDPDLERVVQKLQDLDINRITPIESMLLLAELKRLADK
ncbi:DNA mismatch repair protein MutS [bacterium]|nr:MAG: DNA mismatch repair protein MutS [bacterium]